MKSLILAAFLFIAAISSKATATDLIVTPPALQTFKATFSNTADVKWTIVNHYYRADFMQNNQRVAAFFNMSDGALVVTSRYLTLTDLTQQLQQSLKEHTATGTLIDLFEVEEGEQKDYFAIVQQANETITLKSDSKKWKVYIKK